MKFGTDVENDIVYKIMKSFFEKMFHFWITMQNTLIGCALVTMATNSKIRLHYFVRIVPMYPPPNMVSIGCFVFELHLLPCLANQRPCLVTMATRSKQPLFFTTRHHGLQYGIQHSSADIWESCVKRSPNIGRFCLNPPLRVWWKGSEQVWVKYIHVQTW